MAIDLRSSIIRSAGVALIGLLILGANDTATAASPDAAPASSPFQDKANKLRLIEKEISDLGALVQSLKNDIADYNAVVAMWDEMRKQFLAFEQASKSALDRCGRYREQLEEFRRNYPNQVKRFAATSQHCQSVSNESDALIAEYERSFGRIHRDVDQIKALATMAGNSYEATDLRFKQKEAEKRMVESLKAFPDTAGYVKAFSDIKGY